MFPPHRQIGNEPGIDGLQMAAAQLLLLTAADAYLAARHAPRPALATARIPALIAPLAALAHLTHMSSPSGSTASAVRALNAAVVAAGAATALGGLIAGGRLRGRSTLATLAVASAGLLGLMVERSEREHSRERERLERKASVVRRIVPPGRAKVDHIVVHV